MKSWEQDDIFNIEDIDWGIVDAARSLFQSDLIENINNFLKEKKEASVVNAEPDEEMIMAAGILRRYDNWLSENFETKEMNIALRMLFEHSCSIFSDNRELTADERVFLDNVTKGHSSTDNQNEEKEVRDRTKEPQICS